MKTLKLSIVTLFVSLSIHVTGHTSGIQCSNLFELSTQPRLSQDPFLNYERMEREIEELAADIGSRFGENMEVNRQLEILLQRVSDENIVLQRLQERLLADEVITTGEFYLSMQGLQRIRRSVHQVELLVDVVDAVPAPPKTNQIHNEVIISRKAAKEINALQPQYRTKYNEFISEVSQVPGLFHVNPKWALEKIEMNEIFKGHALYTIRLNHGYRVLFKFDKDVGVTILRISKSLTHNN